VQRALRTVLSECAPDSRVIIIPVSCVLADTIYDICSKLTEIIVKSVATPRLSTNEETSMQLRMGHWYPKCELNDAHIYTGAPKRPIISEPDPLVSPEHRLPPNLPFGTTVDHLR